MRFSFSDEQEEFRLVLRRFLAGRSPTTEVRRQMATEQGFDREAWRKLNQELGLTAVPIPETYGGQGFGHVELGIVLTGEPSLILLDEPTAGMTGEEVVRTTELIREINRQAALIVVEHDMQFIKAIAQRVTVFHQGAILVEDTMANILGNQQVRDIYLGKHTV